MSTYLSCVDILSSYAVSHYAQLYVENDFIYHNRGETQNMYLYDQIEPPKIPLEKVTNTKMILFQGSLDMSSDQDDMRRLINTLKGKKLLINHCY